MSWFRKKRVTINLDFEIAKFFVADLIDPARRGEELNRLIDLLEIPGVRLYYKGTLISPKRLASIAKEAAENFTLIAIAMNPHEMAGYRKEG